MLDEYNALVTNGTWVLMPRPDNVNIVRSMWLFRHKFNAGGSLSRNQGFACGENNGAVSRLGIDCDENFSPVVKSGYYTHCLVVYMHLPPGLDPPSSDYVCPLAAFSYELKQSLMLVFNRVASYATRVGFQHSKTDSSLVISSFHGEFAMTDLGLLNYFLSVAAQRFTTCLFLSQAIYAEELLERAHMKNCNPCRTSVDTNSKLVPDGDPASDPTFIGKNLRKLHVDLNSIWGQKKGQECNSTDNVTRFCDGDKEKPYEDRVEVLGTVRFGNDHIARIMGYSDYQLGNITISRLYYVEGLGHNLFSIGQFYEGDLEVAFRKNTCFIRNLEGVDLLSGSRDTNLYIIYLDDMLKTSLICLLSKASKTKSWLWHRRKNQEILPPTQAEDTNQEKLYLLHMDLCGPMRVASINGKSDGLGKLDAKADIGIFVGYAPAKKAFRVYNKRTQKIIKTIHVTFDEILAMAFEQFSSGPGLHSMTPATSSSGLVPNTVSQQPYILPNRDDWDHLFQPIFDEYFNPPTIAFSSVQEAAAPRAAVLADSPVSTSIDQDALSSSIPSTQEQEHSLSISQGLEESPKTPIFCDDPLHESLHEDSTSQGSSSNMRQIHTLFEYLGTKDHHIAKVIGDPSRSVFMRKQLQTDAMWCYFDIFLTSIELKNFKQAMTEPSWIDAM
ncbi:integrase, catalytic region, zinc finger, CCHC-type containing protein [Tanacetum coccineum]